MRYSAGTRVRLKQFMQSLSRSLATAPFTKGSLGNTLPLSNLPFRQTAFLLDKGDLIFSAALGFVPSIPLTPAAADTIFRYLTATQTAPEDYDAIFTGDLGRVGSRLLYDLMQEKGIRLDPLHKDCGVLMFDESQDVHAGGSGCGCCASVLCSHILNGMLSGKYRNILFIATGALLSPTTVLQKQTIPSIAHLINIRI